jgi:lipopolysaccharide export system protein LptA
MLNKSFLQLVIIFGVLIISIIFFKTYFVKKEANNISKSVINKKESKDTIGGKKSNLIHNIEYTSNGKDGSYYVITAELGELNEDRPEIVLMKNVLATINLKNSNPINISSEIAVFNNVNYNTNFSKNVLVTYGEHEITSDNLDLFFEKNLATITQNIIYKNLNTILEADKVEIDLITKNSKIFMNNQSKKVKVFNIN